VNITELLEELETIYPGESALSLSALQQTARAFCRRTLWYTSDLTISAVSGTQEYTLTDPTNTKIIRVEIVSQGERFLTMKEKPLTTSTSDTQTTYYITEDGKIGFYPIPTSSSSDVIVTVSLQPTRTTTILDDRFAEVEDILIAGALAKLFSIPSYPLYDPQQAGLYQNKYDVDVVNTLASINRKKTSGAVSIQMRTF